MVRQLPPWHENLGKRQVKAPKVYVRDSGLLHILLGITLRKDLEQHPTVGASWEGYAIEEILKALRPDEAYCWATHQGAELDLLVSKTAFVELQRTLKAPPGVRLLFPEPQDFKEEFRVNVRYENR